MNSKIKVGGRTVVASGTLALAGGDTTATITIENIEYHFHFLVVDGVPSVSGSNPTTKSLVFTLVGSPDVPTQWWYPNVGTINGETISLAFVVSTFRGHPERPPGVLLHYTFTSQFSLAGLLTP